MALHVLRRVGRSESVLLTMPRMSLKSDGGRIRGSVDMGVDAATDVALDHKPNPGIVTMQPGAPAAPRAAKPRRRRLRAEGRQFARHEFPLKAHGDIRQHSDRHNDVA
ncbi:hypothetical protein [Bradyrhizobium sediminis]|uniref:hypothetical protein n=1 Tax=Bradyrhizobium sediminis TaxID=2840469 RepID=UPI00352E64FD